MFNQADARARRARATERALTLREHCRRRAASWPRSALSSNRSRSSVIDLCAGKTASICRRRGRLHACGNAPIELNRVLVVLQIVSSCVAL